MATRPISPDPHPLLPRGGDQAIVERDQTDLVFELVGAAALLVACGIIAAFVPARRAARVDPAIALRVD